MSGMTRFAVLVLAPFLLGLAATTAAVADQSGPIAQADFASMPADWRASHLSVSGGAGTLSAGSRGRYDGSQMVLEKAIRLPGGPGGCLHLSMTISDIRESTAVLDFSGSARIFITPDDVSGFADPYGMADAVTVQVTRDPDGVSVSLSEKTQPGNGFGRPLYSGNVDGTAFPLRLDLYLGAGAYRLTCDRPMLPDTGASSGRAPLDGPAWKGDLHFGLRIINYTPDTEAQLVLKQMALSTGTDEALAAPPPQTKPPAAPRSVTVRVRPGLTHEVNGYDTVQPIFGGCVNGTTDGRVPELARDLILNTCREYFWPLDWSNLPGNPPPKTPWAAQQYGGESLSRADALKAWDRWYAQDFARNMATVFAKRPWEGMLKQLELFRQWGVTRHLIFHDNVDGSALRHPQDVDRFYDAYVSAIERNAPWLSADFLQPTNEPNYPWWSGQFADTREAVAAWISVFNQLDGYLRRRHPETVLLGPCVASETMFSWSGWRGWTLPILEGVTHPMEYYNYHMYDIGPHAHLAWLGMLQAQAQLLGHARPQGALTEFNYELDKPADARGERFRWFAEQLFAAMANPDKIGLCEMFILCDARQGGFDNEAAMLYQDAGKLVPSSVYWLYWALSEARGRMLHADCPADAGVQVLASASAPDELAVSLFNDTGAPRTVTVDPGLAAGTEVKGVAARFALVEGGRLSHGTKDLAAAADPVQVSLEPGEVMAVRWELGGPVRQDGVIRDAESYAPIADRPFTDALHFEVQAPQAAGTACLRLGVFSDDLLAARGLTVRVNGHGTSVSWQDAPRGVGDPPGTYLVDVPLQAGWLQPENSIDLIGDGARYRLMFASLVVRGAPPGPWPRP
jgi:hypothetical protein